MPLLALRLIERLYEIANSLGRELAFLEWPNPLSLTQVMATILCPIHQPRKNRHDLHRIKARPRVPNVDLLAHYHFSASFIAINKCQSRPSAIRTGSADDYDGSRSLEVSRCLSLQCNLSRSNHASAIWQSEACHLSMTLSAL